MSQHTTPETTPTPRRLFSRRPEGEKRTPATLAISLLVHVVVVFGLVQLFLLDNPLRQWLHLRTDQRELTVERISFLQLPAKPGTPPTAGRRGGNDRPESRTTEPPPPRLIAPTVVPSTLPPIEAPRPATAREEPGTGPLVGGGGPTRGIRPSYSDPRIWNAPNAPLAAAPKTSSQRLDSVIVAEVRKYRDSVDANTYEPNKFERGDWTANGPGGKWGVDKQAIRLGKVSIPTALLGLLPLNVTQNPTVYEREKSLAAMRADILYHAQSAMTEDEFRKAVKRIRDRKERERKEGDKASKPIAMPEGRD